MKVLVLGATGMAGHAFCRVLGATAEVSATVRDLARWVDAEPFAGVHLIALGSLEGAELAGVLDEVRPDAVVNAIGVVKQAPEARDAETSILVNALLPHRLASLCRPRGVRLVHLSTDCVFSGRRGHYAEDDLPDAEDLYGRSKLVGEVVGPGVLTLRTSILGPELVHRRGLVEWFLSERGRTVRGYARAIFSGFPTVRLAAIVGELLRDHPHVEGLRHLASDPISKLELLGRIDQALGTNVRIEPDETFACDRSLDDRKLRAETGLVTPGWDELVAELAEDVARRERNRPA